jgi:hypothetical protein
MKTFAVGDRLRIRSRKRLNSAHEYFYATVMAVVEPRPYAMADTVTMLCEQKDGLCVYETEIFQYKNERHPQFTVVNFEKQKYETWYVEVLA